MGVIGLTGFVANNLELFTTEFQLKETRLLFDGSALLRFFFNNSREAQLDCQFGGNYVNYAKTVTRFFENLKKHNVLPYVIFQGSQNYGAREEATLLKDRMEVAKLRTLANYSKQLEVDNLRQLGIDPSCLLADKVLRSVLKELDIPHIRTVRFSHEIVGNLAIKLKCPVFSDDSNFYLCNLPGGFINGILFKLNADARNQGVIKCRLYQREQLLAVFGLKAEVLPLLSCVLGNNYRQSESRPKSQTFGNRYMKECWMNDLVDIRALHIARPVLVIDDYSRPSSLRYSRRLLLCLSALVKYYKADDVDPVTLFDWSENQYGQYEFTGENFIPVRLIVGVKVPSLKNVALMTSNKKRRVLFAILHSSLEKFFETELKMIDTHGLEEVEEVEVLALIVLILHYMQGAISEELQENFRHFASAITGSVAFYMKQDNKLMRQLENDRSLNNTDRLDCLYLFNIFQRMVQLFDQANQIFGYPLPEICVHKYFNGVLVANLHHAYKTACQP
ncbi:Protein asteroid -like protein 1 [Halotydeus destructor]|nr:Protein asteroid -like protein 1 [Halotydeus destructor]